MTQKSNGARSKLEALVWIALIVFIGYRIWPQGAAAFGYDALSAPAPSFDITTLEGSHIASDSLRGKVVLVNFWATWCAPCRFEMPGFQSVYQRQKNNGFIVLGITTDGDPDQVSRFIHEHNITYPVAIASPSLARQFGNSSVLPTSYLIDRNGHIRDEVDGYFASVALQSAVKRLLAEPQRGSAGRTSP